MAAITALDIFAVLAVFLVVGISPHHGGAQSMIAAVSSATNESCVDCCLAMSRAVARLLDQVRVMFMLIGILRFQHILSQTHWLYWGLVAPC